MSQFAPYDRAASVRYAAQWALSRNPEYADFTALGGDCANFVSQCLFAGSRLMNATPDVGWYFYSVSRRSPAWSGVKFLHRYLLRASGVGPAGEESSLDALLPGDVVFLSNGSRLYHSLLIVTAGQDPLTAAHTADCWMRPLSSYEAAATVPVHIVGVVR